VACIRDHVIAVRCRRAFFSGISPLPSWCSVSLFRVLAVSQAAVHSFFPYAPECVEEGEFSEVRESRILVSSRAELC
jgi:hypothetical protein